MSTRPDCPQTTSPSRRQFMKTSSALMAGGAALTAGIDIARAAHAAGDDELKVAVIGCGGRGSGAAAQALMTKGKVKLWAAADAFADNIERFLGRRDVRRHSDKIDVPPERRFVGFDAYKDAINSGVDVVILATPPGFRPIHFEAAIEAGKHVFMEKPVAVDAPGVRRVLAANQKAKEKGLAVGVGLQRHHQYPYVETVKRIQDGEIGDVLLTRVYWNGGGVWVRPRQPSQTEMEYQMRNWYYFNWLCGDHIVEQHIHNLDVGNWLKGAHPIKANGMGGREVRRGQDHGEIFDHHAVEYTYEDGSTMLSQCRHIRGCWSIVDEFAHGTRGSARVSGPIKFNDGTQWKYSGPNPNPYEQEHEDLFAAIRNGEPFNEGDYGAHSTMTAILGRLATYSGKVITWDEAINSSVDLSPADYDFNATPSIVPDAEGNYPVAVPGKSQVV